MPKHLSNFFNQTLIKRRDNYWDQKDPSPVRVPDKYDPSKAMYHIYGTRGDDRTRVWEVFHAISKDPHGPWTELEPIQTGIRGAGVAAPGVVYDDADGRVHMFVQTEFLALDGTIEYLTSDDGGYTFYHQGTALKSIPNTQEAGVYDPQPILVKNKNGKSDRYIVYTGMSRVSHGDIYLAKSQSDDWFGPYSRKKLIAHEDVPHHNQHDHLDYEWGLEGGNIIELPDGKFFFIGVSFLPEGQRGTRQRVFGAYSDKIDGKYQTVGPLIDPSVPGENGHPGAIVEGDTVRMFYQERALEGSWNIKIKDYTLSELNKIIENYNHAN